MRDWQIAENGAGGAEVAAQDIHVARGGQVLLDLPHLQIAGAGPTVILGPNGAGKSLALRVLHGLVTPDRGQVSFDGAPLDRAGRARQAMVFQRPVLLRRSVASNLNFVLRRAGVPRAARPLRIAALLAQAGLAHKARQSARSLSGGEAQRLALIRALASAPDVLFLDEPTSSLDPAATQAIEALISQAAHAGTRIIMVSHDMGQARRLAERIVFLNQGRVAETGPADAFFAAPQSREGRAFLGGRLLI